MKKSIIIDGKKYLKLDECHEVARNMASVLFKDKKLAERSYKILEQLQVKRIPIYGLSTQFGSQGHIFDNKLGAEDKIYRQSIRERQENLIKSFECGLGDIVSIDVIRATMLLRANSLARGCSGVRPEIIDMLVKFLNYHIHPIIYRYGSIGASGDLIPLSAIASVLFGFSEYALLGNEKKKTHDIFKKFSIKLMSIESRDGLALMNGTSFMTAISSLAMHDLKIIFPQLLRGIAMTLESLRIYDDGYKPFVHLQKHHDGQKKVAGFVRDQWAGSSLIRTNNKKALNKGIGLQDYYSLRALAHGFGPFYENLQTATKWIEDEMNSANDNPIFDEQSTIYHTANFMGYYITEAADIMKIDIAQASSWIHAILANLYNSRKSGGLPDNLVIEENTHHGFKSIQILSAALAVQNRKLAHSQQNFMIPTEGDNQDVNSLGTHAAIDFYEAVKNLERLTAIVFLSATQALEIRGIGKTSKVSQKVHALIRKQVAFLEKDRNMRVDIESVIELIRKEEFKF
ncbi:MAG: aromatic amino acid lyase [Candidatus Vogelbacteria bacterium]|nr:aromatic amino acid lyase [Candidatus Vogelbacteria bacterium]